MKDAYAKTLQKGDRIRTTYCSTSPRQGGYEGTVIGPGTSGHSNQVKVKLDDGYTFDFRAYEVTKI